jgi:hypothetical protein
MRRPCPCSRNPATRQTFSRPSGVTCATTAAASPPSTIDNNGVYGDDCDLISGQHAPGVGCVWSGAPSPARPTHQTVSVEATMAAARWPPRTSRSRHGRREVQPLARLTGLGMPSGLNMAQPAQLYATNAGMNLFNMNMLGMANLSTIGISPEAQLRPRQTAAAGGGFEQFGPTGLSAGLRGAAVASVGIIMDSARPPENPRECLIPKS